MVLQIKWRNLEKKTQQPQATPLQILFYSKTLTQTAYKICSEEKSVGNKIDFYFGDYKKWRYVVKSFHSFIISGL